MSKNHCSITLENYNGRFYHPGETIVGYVTCDFDKPTTTRGIYINFTGKAHVEWEETDSDNSTTTYRADQNYFSLRKVCVTPKNGEVGKIQIETGIHKFPFQFTLKTDIPSSIEKKYFYIRYEIKAVVEKILSFDYKATVRYNVLSLVNLDTTFNALAPVNLKYSKDTHVMFVKTGDVYVNVQLPKSGYLPDEKIPLVFDISTKNQGVEYVKIQFIKEFKYFSLKPWKKAQSICNIVAETKMDGVGKNSFRMYDINLTVPKDFNIGLLEPCNIIKYTPYILIEAELPFHRNLKAVVPIIIGNIA